MKGLLWSAILLLSVLVAVAFVGHLTPSQAVTPPAAGDDRTGEGIASTGVVTYYSYLPAVFTDLTYAHLTVAKSASPATVILNPGALVSYTVTVQNQGDTTGTLLSVVDRLPAGFAFDSMVPGSDPSTPPAGVTGAITWTGSWSLAPGQQKRFIYRVTPSQTPGRYTNTATVTAQSASVPLQPAAATVTVLPEMLMQEDFDFGTPGWIPFLNHPRLQQGQWYWATADGINGSGALTQDCCAGLADKVAAEALMMYLQPGAQEWTDYRVETMMILRGGADTHCSTDPNGGDPIGLWVRGHYHYSPLQSQWVSGYYVLLAGRADSSENYVQLSKIQQPGDCEACLKPERMYNLDNALPKARSIDLPGRFERNRWYKLAVEVRGASITVYLDDTLVVEWTDVTLPYLSGTVGVRTTHSRTASFDNVSVRPLP
jgi:uncharacterized repeat protein (TIGR01451 family)